jgi:hypothetical protein
MNDSRDTARTLTSALRAVAADDQGLGASAEVEARLIAEVRSIARARRRRANIIGLAAAAALFLGIVLPGWYASRRASAVSDQQTVDDSAGATREITTVFFPLAYSNVPAPDAHLIRLQVPRSALASFGITTFDTPDESATVLADVVVGDDGLARAVRFVRVVSYFEQQELQP